MKNNKFLLDEAKGCFRYFNDYINKGKYFGLMPDAVPSHLHFYSIAATGFALAAFVAGAEMCFAPKEECEEICEKTLDTLLALKHEEGFFYHFYDEEGKQHNNCELSTIDTALLIAGAVTAGEYFGGKVSEKAYKLYDNVNWNYFVDNNRQLLYMSKYGEHFHAWWDVYAEQLLLYVLGCGATNSYFRLNPELFYTFDRLRGSYGGIEFIYSWFGSLFTHQFSHAFVDFQGKHDRENVDWFENSVLATKAARQYCIDNAKFHKGYGENAWGLTACACRHGYEGRYGSFPSGNNNIESLSDGTLAPAGAIGSIVFTPKESLAALQHYSSIEKLRGEYGLQDAYNEEQNWYYNGYISIDKGITLAAISNYLGKTINNNFSKSQNVKDAMKRIGFVE